MATRTEPSRGAAAPPSPAGSVLLIGAIASGVLTVLVTELASAAGRLRSAWVVAGWGVAAAVAVVVVRRRVVIRPPRLTRQAALATAALACVMVIAVLTLIAALYAVPTNWDSMTYRLARASHWFQNGGVGSYPTHIIRQAASPPWGEYAFLNALLVGRGDRLVNLVQWAAMAGSLALTGAIARQLGAGRRGQLVSVLIAATLPMGILQASSTQNDWVVALWLTCLAYAVLADDTRHPAWMWGVGASVGLAALTKVTGYIFALPLVLWWLLRASRSMWDLVRRAAVIAACVVALNLPFYARNVEVFGAPMGPRSSLLSDVNGLDYSPTNRALSPAALASLGVRNLALHLGTPWSAVNQRLQLGIEAFHGWLGLSPDDERTTWVGTRFGVSRPSAQEDLAGNGLALLLVAATFPVALWSAWRVQAKRRLSGQAACVVAGFLLFCAVLKWQPWHSRLHLPLFVLAAPVVGSVLERLRGGPVSVVVTLVVACSVPYLLTNESRPLLGDAAVYRWTRAEQRIRHVQGGRPEYLRAAKLVRETGCRQIGLALGDEDDPEYLLWQLLDTPQPDTRIEHVLVDNPTRRASPGLPPFRPCALIADGYLWPSAMTVDGRVFWPAWSSGRVRVLLPAPPAILSARTDEGQAAVRLELDRTRVRPGDEVKIGLSARTTTDAPPAVLLLEIALPDQISARFVTRSGLGEAVSRRRPSQFSPVLSMPPGTPFSRVDSLAFSVPPAELPPGKYRIRAMLARDGALDDDRIDPDDLLAVDIADFTVVR